MTTDFSLFFFFFLFFGFGLALSHTYIYHIRTYTTYTHTTYKYHLHIHTHIPSRTYIYTLCYEGSSMYIRSIYVFKKKKVTKSKYTSEQSISFQMKIINFF